MSCKKYKCVHYARIYEDGYDPNGNLYPPCPVCFWGGGARTLYENWKTPQKCVGRFESRDGKSKGEARKSRLHWE